MSQPSRSSQWMPVLSILVLVIALLNIKAACIFFYLEAFSHPITWSHHLYVDIWGWMKFWANAKQGLIPYVDFSKEYPLGMGFCYWCLTPLIHLNSPQQLILVHGCFMSLWDILAALIFFILLSEILGLSLTQKILYTLLFACNLTNLLFSPLRHEGIVTCFVLLGLLAKQRNKPWLSTTLWAIGTCLKWYPAFFFLLSSVEEFQLGAKSERASTIRKVLLKIGVFLGIILLLHLPIFLWSLYKHGNIDAFAQGYLFHIKRPIYWDTIPGIWTLWFGRIPWVSLFSWISGMLMFLTALLLPIRFSFEARACLVCMAGLLCNEVYSTQFHLWFYPFLILLLAHHRERRELIEGFGLFLILDLTNVAVFPFLMSWTLEKTSHFAPKMAATQGGWEIDMFSAAVLLRLILLIFIGVWIVKNTPKNNESTV